MPPDLLTFQRDFAAALDVPASGAMAVYRNTVLHGSVEALRSNFPVVEQVVGAEMFEHVAVDFASQCPPSSSILALYGNGFADWLEEQSWIADLPYLPDIARVERLHTKCLMAADAEPITPQADGGAVRLHPSARFDWLVTPAMSLWLAHQRHVGSELQPEWRAEGALFVRPEAFVLHALRIGRAAHRILFGVRLGETLKASLAAAARLNPDEDVPAVLASLVNLGVFAASIDERT